MNTDPTTPNPGATKMEFLIPLGALAAWIILQVWVLPRFGIKS
jgi:hypothetical protein